MVSTEWLGMLGVGSWGLPGISGKRLLTQVRSWGSQKALVRCASWTFKPPDCKNFLYFILY